MFDYVGQAFVLAEIAAMLPDNMQPCGKFYFVSRKEAEKKLANLEPDPNRGPGYILNSYYCFNCDGFHVGHTRVKKL